MKHYITFKDPFNCPLYNTIKDGKKVVEGRKNSPLYQIMSVGDKLIMEDRKGLLNCEITYIKKYKDIREYLENETLERAIPCDVVETIEDGLKIYRSFNSEDDIMDLKKKYGYGFLGIGIKFLSEQKKYQVTVKDPWFSLIRNGKKTVEGRLNKGIFQKISKDDIIIFINKQNNKRFKIKVHDIRKYYSFKEMLEKEGIENVLPRVKDIEQGIKIYNSFYSSDKEKQYGVIGLIFKNTNYQDGGYYYKYIKYKNKYLSLRNLYQ